jgi:hypothetical protein
MQFEHWFGNRFTVMVEDRTVHASIDRKYDSQPVTGHPFFCSEHGFAKS